MKVFFRALCLVMIIMVVAGVTVSCQTEKMEKVAAGKGKEKMAFTIASTAFKHEGMIPIQYTCDGADISPQLAWSNVPEGTKSFALICDDPDAPVGDWVHWVMFNIPSETRELKEEIANDAVLPNGARHGTNDFRKYGYGGPCPPGGTHRYFFKLYALDSMLTLTGKVTKKDLLEGMKGHILGQAELMGKYSRK
jgi:Raf kinase inhibitor-like YbhB/YbcL family protein